MLSYLDKYYIGGEWTQPHSSTTMGVLNPANEREIGTITLACERDVEDAVSAAVKAFDAYSQVSKLQRLEWLQNLLTISRARCDEMAWLVSSEMGAPISMAKSAQAASGIGHLEGFIRAMERQLERETLDNGDDIVREPIGVCALITPWNWPVNQIALKVVPALAAGCTCVLKPSEYTPLSAVLYAEMVREAGFPAGVFNLIQGDGLVAGAALSGSPRVDMVSFTGSTMAGTRVSMAAARTVKRVALELGGKSPNIVFADCDLDSRVTASIKECFFNTGQSCDAPTRMLVERSCIKQVVEIAASVGESIKTGNPAEVGDHLGPLVNQIQFSRVQTLIQKGLDEGLQVLCGGVGKPEGMKSGFYVKPTIFVSEDGDVSVARHEIFGPVLVIVPFDTEEQAIEMSNDTPYGLAAYIQTSDIKKAERVAARLRAGAVHINGGEHQFGSPFGGYKQSGVGREGGLFGLEEFQEIKTLHFGKAA